MMKKTISMILFTLLLLGGMCSMGIADDNKSADLEWTGMVMNVEPDKNLIIISERMVKLISHYGKKGGKVWDTRFLDKNGKQITLDQIVKAMTDVRVRGKEDDVGRFTAKEIRLIDLENQ